MREPAEGSCMVATPANRPAPPEMKPKLNLEVLLTTRLEADRLRLPPYPAIALKLQKMAAEQRTNARELSGVISADAALVAAILRRANAAAGASSATVTGLEQAVVRVGLDEVVRLTLAQSVGVVAGAKGPLASLRRETWRSSLLAARVAQELADRRGVASDVAFIAGLLHDFGAITVLAGLEDLKVELPLLPAETWQQFVDRLHVRFGGVIAARWKLPQAIADAIEHHHAAAAYTGPHKAVVDLVATVDQITSILDRFPDTAMVGMLEVDGLTKEERQRIFAMVPKIAEFMATFESSTPAAAMVKAPSAVEAAVPPLGEGWPIDATITSKQGTFQAIAISGSAFAFAGPTALMPNWLADLTFVCEPTQLPMLANVRTCDSHPKHGFVMTAQPFALDGKDKATWLQLLTMSRERMMMR